MSIEIKVPALGESVTEATVGQWFKKPGDAVEVDEPLVELETDKVTVEVPAPVAGVLADIKVVQGATVGIGSVLGSISEGAAAAAQPAAPAQPAAAPPPPEAASLKAALTAVATGNGGMPPAPAARRIMEEKGLSEAQVQGSGRRGQNPQGGHHGGVGRRAAARGSPRKRSARWRRRRCPSRSSRAIGATTMRASSACDDAPAPDHRAPPQGSAVQRGDAHHVQRRGHERHHEAEVKSTRTCSRSATACGWASWASS